MRRWLIALTLVVFGCARVWSTSSGVVPGMKPPPLTAAGWINGPGPDAESLQGKVVVIDVSAFWCGPCQRAAPGLVKTYNKYKDRGVQFVGLVPDGEEYLDQTQAFVDRFRIPWPTGYGAQSTIDALGVTGFPTTILIGSNGQVTWSESGWHPDFDRDLEQAIERALAAAKQ